MYVATRDAMLKFASDDPWKALKLIDVDAVEIGVNKESSTEWFKGADGGKPYVLTNAADVKALAARLKSENVRVCALLMANDFSGDMNAQVKWGVDMVNAARALGAPAVRVDLIPHDKKMDIEVFSQRCIEGCKKILEQTKGANVALAAENHGLLTNRPEFLEKIFNGVGSPLMGMTLDTGNFYWFGHPIDNVYKAMESFASRVRHTHVKNINYPPEDRSRQREPGWRYADFFCPIDEGNIDHARVAKILKNAGYTGSLCLEDESLEKKNAPEKRLDTLKRNIAHMKDCLARAVN